MGTGMLTINRFCPALRGVKPYFGSKAKFKSCCLMESVGGKATTKQQQGPGSTSPAGAAGPKDTLGQTLLLWEPHPSWSTAN